MCTYIQLCCGWVCQVGCFLLVWVVCDVTEWIRFGKRGVHTLWQQAQEEFRMRRGTFWWCYPRGDSTRLVTTFDSGHMYGEKSTNSTLQYTLWSPSWRNEKEAAAPQRERDLDAVGCCGCYIRTTPLPIETIDRDRSIDAYAHQVSLLLYSCFLLLYINIQHLTLDYFVVAVFQRRISGDCFFFLSSLRNSRKSLFATTYFTTKMGNSSSTSSSSSHAHSRTLSSQQQQSNQQQQRPGSNIRHLLRNTGALGLSKAELDARCKPSG